MKNRLLFSVIIVFLLLTSCQTFIPSENTSISVNIIHDGQTDSKQAALGSTIQQVISASGISLGSLDEVSPSLDEVAVQNETITIVRIKEDYEVEETTLPFESQTVKNESLAVGQTLLIQAGVNGTQSNTYRVIKADGVERSRTIVKTEITKPAQPEIIMVGIQSPYKSINIQGIFAYITSSNAWVMEGTTGNRREVVDSGDLDGRIFTLSPDGSWLLYSASPAKKDEQLINTLWFVDVTHSGSQPIPLGINNVVNYAQWVPGKNLTIAFSTVEQRSAPPGWQANNDLIEITFDESGKISNQINIIDTNPGGVYGWWGTSYNWAPDGSEIAYARPDGIGLVNAKDHTLEPKIEFSAYQTQGDWAWVPGISWCEGHTTLYTVLPISNMANNNSFSLSAFVLGINTQIDIATNTGMFAYPEISNSPERPLIAYLSAVLPDQSNTSSYELRVIDRDGSNIKKLYPEEGIQGLEPQQVTWSPIGQTDEVIAFIASGNIMFVNPETGEIQQITGDQSVSKIDWK